MQGLWKTSRDLTSWLQGLVGLMEAGGQRKGRHQNPLKLQHGCTWAQCAEAGSECPQAEITRPQGNF